MEYMNINDIPGIRIGHEQDLDAATGCTVIICEEGASAGVDVRGGAPGTRETDLLNPINMVDRMHGVLLSGGSAFGLDAAAGIMQYLEERGIGYDMGVTRVPIVGGAVLFDLSCGDYRVRPDKEMGYNACKNSEKNQPAQGNVGAGTGATVGKLLGMGSAMKGGLGTCCARTGDLVVGAIAAVNCLGDIYDPESKRLIAGALIDGNTLANTEEILISRYAGIPSLNNSNTTIGAIITNARLDKPMASKVASMAHNGYARTIRPAHTMYDGDTIFAMATGMVEADVNTVGLIAARMMERAVVNAVKSASSIHGFKCCNDLVV